jgi:hypothetical protein
VKHNKLPALLFPTTFHLAGEISDPHKPFILGRKQFTGGGIRTSMHAYPEERSNVVTMILDANSVARSALKQRLRASRVPSPYYSIYKTKLRTNGAMPSILAEDWQ